jgi:hypothetical protein
MTFTPINELPKPAQFLLDELDEETKKYNTILLSKILYLNIPEVRPIRLEFKKKFNSSPVAIMLNKIAENSNVSLAQFIKNKKISMIQNNKTNKLRFNAFPEDFKNQLRFKKGKNKGQYNPKLKLLCEQIFEVYSWFISTNSAYKESIKQKIYEIGFWNFFEYNFNKYKNKPQAKWFISF